MEMGMMEYAHLLRLPLDIRMHQRDMVVAADDVSQRRQALLDALDLDAIRYRVAQVLEFLVRRRGRDEETFAVPASRRQPGPIPSVLGSGKRERERTYPAVKRPIILVPAIVA